MCSTAADLWLRVYSAETKRSRDDCSGQDGKGDSRKNEKITAKHTIPNGMERNSRYSLRRIFCSPARHGKVRIAFVMEALPYVTRPSGQKDKQDVMVVY